MITAGFVQPVLDRIPEAGLRGRVTAAVQAKLGQYSRCNSSPTVRRRQSVGAASAAIGPLAIGYLDHGGERHVRQVCSP